MATPRNSSQPGPSYRLPLLDRPPAAHGSDCLVALKALGEDTRVRIIGLLIDAPLDVGEIAKRVGVSQYNVSKHLRILREAGLLHVHKAGRRHLYALPDGLQRGAAESRVMDLGCCSFKFDNSATDVPPAETSRHSKRPAAGRTIPTRSSGH